MDLVIDLLDVDTPAKTASVLMTLGILITANIFVGLAWDHIPKRFSRKRLLLNSIAFAFMAFLPIVTAVSIDGWPHSESFEPSQQTIIGIIITAILIYYGVRYGHTERLKALEDQALEVVTTGRSVERANAVAAEMGLNEPEVIICNGVAGEQYSAFCFSADFPSVMLTEQMADLLSDGELDAIMAHELRHYTNHTFLWWTLASTTAACLAVWLGGESFIVTVALYFALHGGLARIASRWIERDCDFASVAHASPEDSARGLRRVYQTRLRSDVRRSIGYWIDEAVSTHPALETRLVRLLGNGVAEDVRLASRNAQRSGAIAVVVWTAWIALMVRLGQMGYELTVALMALPIARAGSIVWWLVSRLYRHDLKVASRGLDPYRYPAWVIAVPGIVLVLFHRLADESIKELVLSHVPPVRIFVVAGLATYSLFKLRKRWQNTYYAGNLVYSGKYEDGLKAIEQYEHANGSHPYLEQFRIYALSHLDRFDEAIDVAARCVEAYSATPAFHLYQLNLLGATERYDNLLSSAEKWNQKYPQTTHGHLAKCTALMHLQEMDAARDALAPVQQTNPSHAQFHWAEWLIRAGEHDQAATLLEELDWISYGCFYNFYLQALYDIGRGNREAAQMSVQKLVDFADANQFETCPQYVLTLVREVQTTLEIEVNLGERLTRYANKQKSNIATTTRSQPGNAEPAPPPDTPPDDAAAP